MKDSDLRHLRRADLLALLEDLSRENDRLRAELADTKSKLEAKEMRLSECGSLAEAALQLSGVYEAADRAAKTYLALVKQNHPEDAGNSLEANRKDGVVSSAASSPSEGEGVLAEPEQLPARDVRRANVYAVRGPAGSHLSESGVSNDEGGER